MDWGTDDPVVTDQTVGGSNSVADLVNPYTTPPAGDVPPAAGGGSYAAPTHDAPFTYDPNAPGPVSADGVPLVPLFRRLENAAGDPNVVSHAIGKGHGGAVGLMQVTPATAAGYGFDPSKLTDPDYNVMVGTKILSDLNSKYGGDVDAVAIGYNSTPGYLRKWLASGRNDSVLMPETQGYLARMRRYIGEAQPVAATPAPSWGSTDPTTPAFGQADTPTPSFGQNDPVATKPGFMEEAARLGESAAGGVAGGASQLIKGLQGLGGAIQAADIQRDYNAVRSGDAAKDGWTQAQQDKAVRDYQQLQATGAGPEPHPRAQAAIASAAEAAAHADVAISPTNRHGAESVLHGAGVAAPALLFGAADPLAGAVAFGAQGYQESSSEAAAKGKTPAQQRTAGLENAAVQAGVGLVPFGKPLEGAVAAVGHPVARAMARVGMHSAADATMMGTMQAGSNVVAEQNYDPNRPLGQGVAEAALTGGVAGSVIHTGHEVFNAASGRLRPAEAPPGPNGEAPTVPMPATDAIEQYIGEREAPKPVIPGAPEAPAPASEAINEPLAAKPEAIAPEVAVIAADVPPAILQVAAADVDEHRAAAPPSYSLFSAIKDLGGMRVKEEDGSATAGQDVQGALADVKRKPPGMINNKTGMSPDQMHEALADRGWLPADDPEALANAIQREASGDKVYHPEADTPELLARRHALDHEMGDAGVTPEDVPDVAAAKLAAWRYGEMQRGSTGFEALRGHADELGVPYTRDTSYSDLLGDVIEREALQGEASHAGFDAHEREIHGELTEADLERLDALAAEGTQPEHGESPSAFPLPEGWESEPGVPEAYSGAAEGAGGGGEGAPEATGEAAPLSFGHDDPAEQSSAALRQAQERGSPQHGFDITDRMKEAAQGGFPLFARGVKEDLGAPRMHQSISTVPVGEASAAESAVMAKVEKAIGKIAPFVETHAFRTISEKVGNETHEAMGMAYRDRLRHIIAYALEAGDSVRVARHEAVHALRKAGVIHPEEWDALAHAAVSEGWIERYRIPERYGDLDHEAQIEEAIAEHFSSWKRDGLKGAPSFVNEAFTRIRQFLAHVADIARQFMGRGVTADDVLSRLERGEVGARPMGVDTPAGRIAFGRPTDQSAFERWFGRSKVVDDAGKPLVVYHGTKGNFESFKADPNGIHFGTPEQASMRVSGEGKTIIPAYLQAENLQRSKDLGGNWSAKVKAAKATGKDGIVYLNRYEGLDASVIERLSGNGLLSKLDGMSDADFRRAVPEAQDSYIVFRPEQAKSIFNRGSYDPNDPRILFARKGVDEEKKGPAGVVNRILGPGAEAVGRKVVSAADRAIPDPVSELIESAKMGISPMGTGSERAQASAKDFANALRQSAFQWGKLDEWLQKEFTPEQQRRMWEAADEEGVIRRRGETPGPGEGFERLSPKEADAVLALQARADAAFKRAQDIGMVKGEGLESYVPRMVVEMTAAGPKVVSRATPKQAKRGANLSTTTGQLRQRKYERAEETEAAAKKAFGAGAEVVRNIRTLGLATQRLEQAIAGRTLVDKIKAMSKDAGGGPLVAEGANPDPASYFTMEGHPALTQWAPKMIKDAESGKWTVAVDQNGDPVFEAHPLWISKEFEGPLKAVLTSPSGGITRALMDLKGKMMSVIMYSPLMHNAVIWGKAIPADPVGVLSLQAYRRGNLARKDSGTMLEAIGAGMDPIGHRYFNQDIAGIAAAEGQDMTPGRSWTSQVLAFVPGLFDRAAGEAVKRGVDKLGDVWHNTFLWDRIADLQAGLYVHIRDGLVAKGVDATSAQRTAAHFANRYAGALPMEGMSKMARNIANLALFSRSFTLGNMAAYKDMVMGMPSDVRAQIARDGGTEALEKVQGLTRAKALGMLGLDVALQYAGLSLASLAVAWLTKEAVQFPWQNEAGKENRFLIGYGADGTAVYGRLPTGKVAEDLTDWVMQPRETLLRKLSPYGRLMYEMASNDRGFGQRLYDPFDHSPVGLAKNVGRVVWAFMGGIAPLGQIEAAQEAVSGSADRKTAALQALAPFTGLTISKGAPGGPQMATLYQVRDEQNFRWQEARPAIVAKIKAGDIAGARKDMTALGVSYPLQAYQIRATLNPRLRMSARAVRDFMLTATPEQKAQFEAERAATQQRQLDLTNSTP